MLHVWLYGCAIVYYVISWIASFSLSFQSTSAELIEITIHDTFCCASKFQGQPTESVSKNAPSSNHLGSVIEKIEGLYVVCKVLCTSSLFFGDNVTQIHDGVLIFIAFIWLKHLLDALHFNFWSFVIYVHQKDYIPHIAF